MSVIFKTADEERDDVVFVDLADGLPDVFPVFEPTHYRQALRPLSRVQLRIRVVAQAFGDFILPSIHFHQRLQCLLVQFREFLPTDRGTPATPPALASHFRHGMTGALFRLPRKIGNASRATKIRR